MWQIRVSAGVDLVTGKPRTVTETYRGGKKDAQRRLAELVAKVNAGRTATADITVRDTLAMWRKSARHAASTARNYDLGERTIPARLLDTPIGRLRAATIRSFVEDVQAEHGPHRARLVHAVISGACTFATRQEWISSNPARLVSPPSVDEHPDTTPDVADVVKAMEFVAADLQFLVWLRLSAVLATRPGEVLAVRWSAIDWEASKVHVAVALDRVSGALKDTKTHDRRNLAIDAETLALLKRWRAAAIERALAAGKALAPDAFVLSDAPDSMRPWRPDLATKRWAKIRRRAGLPSSVRLYDFRHFVMTTLIASGVDPKTAQTRAGHRRLATTTDRYAHAQPARDQVAARVMGDTLGGRDSRRRRVVVRRAAG